GEVRPCRLGPPAVAVSVRRRHQKVHLRDCCDAPAAPILDGRAYLHLLWVTGFPSAPNLGASGTLVAVPPAKPYSPIRLGTCKRRRMAMRRKKASRTLKTAAPSPPGNTSSRSSSTPPLPSCRATLLVTNRFSRPR